MVFTSCILILICRLCRGNACLFLKYELHEEFFLLNYLLRSDILHRRWNIKKCNYIFSEWKSGRVSQSALLIRSATLPHNTPYLFLKGEELLFLTGLKHSTRELESFLSSVFLLLLSHNYLDLVYTGIIVLPHACNILSRIN